MKKIIFLFFFIIFSYSLTLFSIDFNKKISLNQVYEMCGGKNISPTLQWKNIPKNAKSLAITMFDPDAPNNGWWHWIIINIPTNIQTLPANSGNIKSKYFNIGFQTKNDYGGIGYGGPCPPSGEIHRYIITIYALNIEKIETNRNINPNDLYKIIKKYTISTSSIVGFYKRGWK